MIELMCNCPELQSDHRFAEGDRFYVKGKIMRWWQGSSNNCLYKREHYIWIPTQKQIQQMFMKWTGDTTDHYVRTEFYRWYNEFHLKHGVWRLTGDEVWIAFYMYRVHNKVWKFKTKKKQWKEV